jgi:hydroxyacylglutathione hydrolase
MDIEAIVDEGIGNVSYLVDLGEGSALVIDPGRDPRPYVAAAARRGLRIAYTADTHLHNDFVSGSRELQAIGAAVLGSAEAGLAFAHRGLWDEEEVEVGRLTLRALATPGHTPEHLAYLLLDRAVPVAVFTGGSLLRGSVARTDLLGADRAEALAGDLYRSVRSKLFTLADDVAVYPTHGAGNTFCAVAPTTAEGAASTEGTSTTIGVERRTNSLLGGRSEDEFVRSLLLTFSSYPQYFHALREVNRRGPRVYGESRPTLPPLGVDEVQRFLAAGAAIVDVRPIDEFAAGHIGGALSDALRPAFGTWLGWLVEPSRDLIFVMDDDEDRAEVVRQCLSIGFERLAGELDGGMPAWGEAGLPEATIELLRPEQADRATLLDVRQQNEFESAHIPGARHVELGSLEAEAPALPVGSLTVHCGHGERAMTGASLLERAGRQDLAVLLGGPGEWSLACGVPLEHGGR